jgi:hypothetical protein
MTRMKSKGDDGRNRKESSDETISIMSFDHTVGVNRETKPNVQLYQQSISEEQRRCTSVFTEIELRISSHRISWPCEFQYMPSEAPHIVLTNPTARLSTKHSNLVHTGCCCLFFDSPWIQCSLPHDRSVHPLCNLSQPCEDNGDIMGSDNLCGIMWGARGSYAGRFQPSRDCVFTF